MVDGQGMTVPTLTARGLYGPPRFVLRLFYTAGCE
jgi:hypothetical protein